MGAPAMVLKTFPRFCFKTTMTRIDSLKSSLSSVRALFSLYLLSYLGRGKTLQYVMKLAPYRKGKLIQSWSLGLTRIWYTIKDSKGHLCFHYTYKNESFLNLSELESFLTCCFQITSNSKKGSAKIFKVPKNLLRIDFLGSILKSRKTELMLLKSKSIHMLHNSSNNFFLSM